MILASAVLSRVQTILTDASFRRFTQPELLMWLADAWREVLIYKPQAGSVTAELVISADQWRHALPAAYLRLLDIVSAGGRAVTAATRQQLDQSDRTWRTRKGTTIRHYVVDEENPREFEVYPVPATAVTAVAVLVPNPPNSVATPETEIPLDSTCMGPLVDLVVYRALSKDAADTFNAQRALAHYQAFANAMGVKIQNNPLPRAGEK